MAVTVKIEMARLQHLMGSVAPNADRIVEAAARQLESRAKQLAPVDTGAMRASIAVTNTGPAQRRIGPTTRYAVFVEMGTRHKAARPFLMPAFDAVVGTLQQQLRGVVD